MEPLRRATLSKDPQKDDWKLTDDITNKVIRRFETKADATTAGALGDALGSKGGSVRIEKERGGYQEERTFPRARDPRSSKG